jgi:hypothetical protein
LPRCASPGARLRPWRRPRPHPRRPPLDLVRRGHRAGGQAAPRTQERARHAKRTCPGTPSSARIRGPVAAALLPCPVEVGLRRFYGACGGKEVDQGSACCPDQKRRPRIPFALDLVASLIEVARVRSASFSCAASYLKSAIRPSSSLVSIARQGQSRASTFHRGRR